MSEGTLGTKAAPETHNTYLDTRHVTLFPRWSISSAYAKRTASLLPQQPKGH